MVKNKKSRDIGETVWTTVQTQKVSKNHFQKIGKFENISPRENQNTCIKE